MQMSPSLPFTMSSASGVGAGAEPLRSAALDRRPNGRPPPLGAYERHALEPILPFVAQSHTPSDHCVRFASAVADDCATLASRRCATALPGPVFHRQDRVSFA